MRLIDADALLAKLRMTDRYFMVKFDIEEAPTVERPHGEWEWAKTDYSDNGSIYCTNCRTSLLEDVPEIRMKGKLYEFCPYCGAKMKRTSWM